MGVLLGRSEVRLQSHEAHTEKAEQVVDLLRPFPVSLTLNSSRAFSPPGDAASNARGDKLPVMRVPRQKIGELFRLCAIYPVRVDTAEYQTGL